ncbi:hypothetical protein [Tahibacter sp.]|uniref:hypothetical protein n=1 Tax=Tahibacter sp. TaxID=2056211 RepID=UPI0028C3DCCB|nr:hypothetical protein [Tahibacter sp.]
MPHVTKANLVGAIRQIERMTVQDKLEMADAIFIEQPNLLASVLCMARAEYPPEHVDVLLDLLMITIRAVSDAGIRLEVISEEAQDRELRRLVAMINFSQEARAGLLNESLLQFPAFEKEPWLASYVLSSLQESGILFADHALSKNPIMVALNMVACIATAKERGLTTGSRDVLALGEAAPESGR